MISAGSLDLIPPIYCSHAGFPCGVGKLSKLYISFSLG
jgi:hypothetical protein